MLLDCSLASFLTYSTVLYAIFLAADWSGKGSWEEEEV